MRAWVLAGRLWVGLHGLASGAMTQAPRLIPHRLPFGGVPWSGGAKDPQDSNEV